MNYFSYGTLHDLEGIQDFAPSAKSLLSMTLKGYQVGLGELRSFWRNRLHAGRGRVWDTV